MKQVRLLRREEIIYNGKANSHGLNDTCFAVSPPLYSLAASCSPPNCFHLPLCRSSPVAPPCAKLRSINNQLTFPNSFFSFFIIYPIPEPKYGDTPLHTAARYGHAGVARILLSAKSNPNQVNKVSS